MTLVATFDGVEHTLVKDADYTLEYDDNYHASYEGSKATVTITGTGNFDKSRSKQFTINKVKNEIYNFAISDISYGSIPEPTAQSKFGEIKFAYSTNKYTNFYN